MAMYNASQILHDEGGGYEAANTADLTVWNSFPRDVPGVRLAQDK